MGNRSPRLYGCRVGICHRSRCGGPQDGKVTLVCKYGHVMTIWLCAPHIKMVKRRYLICKTCHKMGRDDVKCREMPLVADLPLRFRTLDAQFDSE